MGRRHVDVALLAAGLPIDATDDHAFAELTSGVVESFHEKARLLADLRSPVDTRIEAFLGEHFADLGVKPKLPESGIVLFRHGIARELSLPSNGDEFTSELLSSYRVRNGVLHNPRSDRRTTAGTFHVAEGGLPVPSDKRSVPKGVFAQLMHHAVNPPESSLVLPFHAHRERPTKTWVSLLLRPRVCPEVPGVTPEKTMEVRFFAPGSLVSNLDFVESIFGNAGDPYLPRNDAALDVIHWTGHTGCVILAPHLTGLTKKSLGLPNVKDATPRQKRDKMCWEKEDEKYNDGVAFKVTCRTKAGVIVTLIADNYYGYCKKEVKTQISYAANLFGNCEEEHAGGALAFPRWAYGAEFVPDKRHSNGRTLADVVRDLGDAVETKVEGYAVDREFENLIYVPEGTRASIARQELWWAPPQGQGQGERAIPMSPGKIYMLPSGFKLELEKHPGAPSYRIVGTAAEYTNCHKPCTVSGGGKSEISKSLQDYMLYGPIFVNDPEKDFALVDEILNKDYGSRWKTAQSRAGASRGLLSEKRTLGSVIKLLTPSPEYSTGYTQWLESIPNHIFAIVYIIKRFYKPEWGDWKQHFSVDTVNGVPGHELKLHNRKLVGTYLRVGFVDGGGWRTFKLRQDFMAARKIQTEDDISAAVVVPPAAVEHLGPGQREGMSRKFLINCEYRLFQRPDDAIHRGLDKQTELDMSREDNFISNFEPLPQEQLAKLVQQVTTLSEYSLPMRSFLQLADADAKAGASRQPKYTVSSSEPRIVDGKRTANPRYLQIRPDLLEPLNVHAARQGIRLRRAIPPGKPVLTPVDAVLVGRRNNPPDVKAGIRALAVYNPIHYQELPELLMDFVSSLTGKSPSTTGAGSEGALTKGPFNALRPTADLNQAVCSYILTGLPGFSTAAGYIGPNFRVDHDVSLLVPEIWARMTLQESDPKWMIAQGHLEQLQDIEDEKGRVLASRLGYRITASFVRTFFGRIFDNPSAVFGEQILRPEKQDLATFLDGVRNITEAHERVAKEYFEDGTVEDACPPLRALLHIMARGTFEGKTAHHPEIRDMFTREHLLASEWYQARLTAKQRKDIALWQRHVASLRDYLEKPFHQEEADALALPHRLLKAEAELSRVTSPEYLKALVGTLGVDPTV